MIKHVTIGLMMLASAFTAFGQKTDADKDILVIEHNDKWLSATDYRANIAKAEAGDPVAQRIVARCYMTGIGIATDFQEGWKWMARAAGSGDLEAQYQLGLMYRDGKGVERSVVA